MLVTCLGCNQVYGLEKTHDRDAAPPLVLPDGAVLVTPPPGPTVCGAMPDFEAWSYGRVDVAPSPAAFDLSLYNPNRAIVVGPTKRELWDVDLATGDATHLSPLDPPTAAEFRDPSMLPDGSVLWFRQTIASQGLFVATRASNWQKARETFGFVDPFSIELGTPGFHDGTLRMVIALQGQASDPVRLVELSSNDGIAWTRLDTITFDQSAIPGIITGPHLSADGCVLLFSTVSTLPYSLYAVARDGVKQFSGAPKRLVAASSAGGYPTNPALAPDQRSLWLAAQVAEQATLVYRLFRGQ